MKGARWLIIECVGKRPGHWLIVCSYLLRLARSKVDRCKFPAPLHRLVFQAIGSTFCSCRFTDFYKTWPSPPPSVQHCHISLPLPSPPFFLSTALCAPCPAAAASAPCRNTVSWPQCRPFLGVPRRENVTMDEPTNFASVLCTVMPSSLLLSSSSSLSTHAEPDEKNLRAARSSHSHRCWKWLRQRIRGTM
jgi:hypothetical protein